MCCSRLPYTGKLSCPCPIPIFPLQLRLQETNWVAGKNITGSSDGLKVCKRTKCSLGLHDGPATSSPSRVFKAATTSSILGMQFPCNTSLWWQHLVYWTWSHRIHSLLGRQKLLPESSQADPWKGQGSGSMPKEVESFCECEVIVAFCV